MTDTSEVMTGFPPATEHQVTLANWRNPPFNRWAFRNVSQIVPCAMVWCGETRAELSGADRDLSEVTFEWSGETLTVAQMLEHTFTDGLVVLQEGRLVYEAYLGGHEGHVPHILFSVTKSIAGLLAGVLVGQDRLDPDAALTAYIPELERSGLCGRDGPATPGHDCRSALRGGLRGGRGRHGALP